jgi:alkylated DNA nucleotide flippase Atl1
MTKRVGKLDLEAAAGFLATIPEGRWTSYGDVAVAAGRSSRAGQPVASWLGSKGHLVPYVHRVLNDRGEISSGWQPAGPGVPETAGAVEELLRLEGVRFINGRADQRNRWRPADVRP